MADLSNVDTLIGDMLAQAVDDDRSNDQLRACLIAGLGNAIALRSKGSADLAAMFCDQAGIQVVEAATLAATLFDDAGRL